MNTIISVGKEFEDTLGNDGLTQVLTKAIAAKGSVRLLVKCKKRSRSDLIRVRVPRRASQVYKCLRRSNWNLDSTASNRK